MRRAAYRVRGRVQGVGFRWWARSQALRLGIAGTVRNCEDGAVELQARGSDGALEELRRLLEEGPPGARVDSVEEVPAKEDAAEDFQIVR
jgi:acylphosphatase